MKGRNKALLYVNFILLVLIAAVATYSWMLTEAQSGENLQYDRELFISSSTVTVEMYEYVNNTYTLINDDPFTISNVAPGVNKQYRFDITNNESNATSTNIVFADITGDIAELQNSFYFNSTNPLTVSKQLGTNLRYDETFDVYYLTFIEEFQVPAGQTVSLYWYATIDKRATNEVANKSLNIDSIVFIKP